MLYLTATLPPSEDPRFYQAIGVPVADVVPFREATTRHNAAYWVVAYPRGEEEAEVSRLVEEREARYPPPSQIVVYCKRQSSKRRVWRRCCGVACTTATLATQQ